eukprot:Gregarina_sp_Pseudo_9__108@NODE_1072_length_1905_cov_87_724009_g1004_i0_p1_GENE_NODE_1072_length_1905_cov_87_724009_g1004_i0NODE_1072_length_1905_cov_87_724009_g1004_i0_p1_ORF_typecomplete_len542_score158_91GHMP_kinases_C/PF08544_13/1_3e04GHMP_kinases_C/PF08544_13/1_4e04GHMP_kinases_C/PF08544_13/5_7e02GHMP_kinases_C/PF08544_13/3_3e17GalKase_gal_bdg/PF10509_9/8_3e16GHMP_kinases_N/PF00288_26/1_6e12_NODE_1072_length_1905_cov_87_724009_g1004_i01931818
MQYVKKISAFIESKVGGGGPKCVAVSSISIPDDSDGHEVWASHFAEPFPNYHVVAPGRVNLIGEHIDHQNYNVLPCAVEKSAHILLSVQDKTASNCALEIKHLNSKTFSSRKFNSLKDIKIDKSHHWTNYIVAAYLGMTEYYVVDKDTSKIGTHPKLLEEITDEQLAKLPADHLAHKSVRLLVTGNLPMAAGLSSSSALVVCSAMCFCAKSPVEPKEIAAICANCERYVGTAGGGMDQAAICLCHKDEAQWIGFHPLTAEPVKLPHELKIVVANTCREANKVKGAAKMYNKRVFELKTACLWLVQQFAAEEAEKLDGKDTLNLTLRDVLRNYVKMSEDELLQKLETYIPNKTYTKEDVNKILGDERRKTLLELRCGNPVWEKNDDFYLHNRIKHVLTENARVTEFVNTCRAMEKETDEAARTKGLIHLGELLNGSGKSLKEDFDASCDEIEELCQIARDAGAVGSRLTGAGWGGCTVSLVPEHKVEEFMTKVKENYFIPYIEGTKKKEVPLEVLPSDVSSIDDVFFATTPAQCARVITIAQ